MPQPKREYRDLDLDFRPHPVSGDINILTEEDAVKRSVRNLIFHNFYERPFKSDVGSGVVQSLFENLGPIEVYKLKSTVRSVIARKEPRATVQNIEVIEDVDRNAFTIRLVFTVNNTLEPVTIDVFLKRVR